MAIPLGLSTVNMGGLDLFAEDSVNATDIILSDMEGWEGKPKPSIEVTRKPRQPGGWAGESFSGARHVAMSGWLRTDDPSALQGATDALNAAFDLSETLMRVTEYGVTRWVMARNEDEVIVKRVSSVAAKWSAQVVVLDPRKFGAELTAFTGLPSSAGGLTVPFTVPFSVDAVTVSGQVNLTNPGNAAGPVRLRIDGPVTGPVVTHVGSGASLMFASSLVLGAGEYLDIDMEARTVLANGQSSRSGWVTARGWSQFEVGKNTWSFTAAAFDPGSRLTVMATPSYQ